MYRKTRYRDKSILTLHSSSLSSLSWLKDRHTQTSLACGSCGIRETVKRSNTGRMNALQSRSFPSCALISLSQLHIYTSVETGCSQKVLQRFMTDFGSHFNCLDWITQAMECYVLYRHKITHSCFIKSYLVLLSYCVTSKNQDLFAFASVKEH